MVETGTQQPQLLSSTMRRTRVQSVLHELAALLQVSSPTAGDIHRTRICIKKLRAWIRLLRRVDGRRTGRESDAALRACAAGYSAARDRHVLEQTLALLQQRAGDTTAAALSSLLSALPAAPIVQLPSTLAVQSWVSLRSLCARQPEARKLVAGLRGSYQRARRLGKRAVAADATPMLRHRWRKRVKYLGYQLQLVCVDGKHGPLPAALDRLGSTLGALQDLHVLEQHLALVQPTAENTETLALAARLLAHERKRQLALVARQFRRCFAGKEPEFTPHGGAPGSGDPCSASADHGRVLEAHGFQSTECSSR